MDEIGEQEGYGPEAYKTSFRLLSFLPMGETHGYEALRQYQVSRGADAVQGEVHESVCGKGNACHGYCAAG